MAWFLDQNGLHGGGMATALWQSAPGTVAASLEGRPRRMCRNRLPSALGPATGSGMTSAAVKISHRVLPEPPSSHPAHENVSPTDDCGICSNSCRLARSRAFQPDPSHVDLPEPKSHKPNICLIRQKYHGQRVARHNFYMMCRASLTMETLLAIVTAAMEEARRH